MIEIDVPGRSINVVGVDLESRPSTTHEPYVRTGALAHYALLVGSASHGAVLAGLDSRDDEVENSHSHGEADTPLDAMS